MIWWAQIQIRDGFASLGSLGLGFRKLVCMYIYIYIYEFFYAKRFHESLFVRKLYLLVDHVWL